MIPLMKTGPSILADLLVVLLILLAGNPAGAAQDTAPAPIDAEELNDLVVLSRGRMKPFATHARESLIGLFGTADLNDRSPRENYLRLLFNRDDFLDAPWFEVGTELADTLFDGRQSLSAREVVEERERLIEFVSTAQEMFEAHGKGKDADRDLMKRTDEIRNQIMDLFGRVNRLRGPIDELRFLPDPTSRSGEWLNIDEARALVAHGHEEPQPGVDAFERLEKSYLAGDGAAFAESAAALKAAQRLFVDNRVLSTAMVRLELFYYAIDFKVIGLIVFVLSSVLFLVQALGRSPVIGRVASSVMILGILWNCWIIAGHTAIAGRLPLKNLQEVYLVVLFFVPLIGLLLQILLKSRVYSAMSAVLASIGFTGSLFLEPEGYMIAPLVAILQSPWRQVHILTIMLSYAILLVAFGLHVAYLCRTAFVSLTAPAASGPRSESLALDLDHKAYLLVAWGFLFLTIGISTGAAWGHSSWGRYWGWDPKEVWATVAWAIYALFLHMRIFFRAPRWALALINIVGYAAILFTYFGVTYLLPGLHAYS